MLLVSHLKFFPVTPLLRGMSVFSSSDGEESDVLGNLRNLALFSDEDRGIVVLLILLMIMNIQISNIITYQRHAN